MSDPYAFAKARTVAALSKWRTGTVTLTRSEPGTPDAEEPWVPGVPITTTYTLDARLDGVAADFVDDVTIIASDQVVIASPKATAPDGSTIDLAPRMTDLLSVDGRYRVVKKIVPVPSAGNAARYHIFIGA